MGIGEAASTRNCLVPPSKQPAVPAGTEGHRTREAKK